MTTWYTNHPIDQALQNLRGEVSPETRLKVIWRAYEQDTGEIVGDDPTLEQREKIHYWLNYLCATASPPVTLSTSRSRLHSPVSLNIPSKAGLLSQRLCNACEPVVYDDGSTGMMISMPIVVPPWSAQSAKKRNMIIKDAIHQQLAEKKHQEPWADSPVCLNIAAVIPRSPRYIKDVDNLVKGLLDSLSGILYVDDKQIQCLTTRRFEYASDVGYYQVSATAVHPWTVDVIYDSPKTPGFLSGIINLPGKEEKA